MKSFVIRAAEQHSADGQTTVSARLDLPEGRHELWFRGPEGVLRARGADAFVITCLPAAMKLGLDLTLEEPVSPKLLASMSLIQDILCKWHPLFHRVEIQARPAPAPPPGEGAATASFFSGGVDSWYTALKHRETISGLILVHGFDLPLENIELRTRVSKTLAEAARNLRKPLLEIETNSRQLTNRRTDWTFAQFGPSLAGIACLIGGCDRILIPSSESYARLDVCASHPLLDPLWSTEYVSLIHDGAECDRVEKVAAIGRYRPALDWLRVCWRNPGNAYNCGVCEKCIRTMLCLEAAGIMESCSAFEAPLDVARVAAVRFPNQLVLYHFQECLRALVAGGASPELTRALERAMARAEGRQVRAALKALVARRADRLVRRGRARLAQLGRRLPFAARSRAGEERSSR